MIRVELGLSIAFSVLWRAAIVALCAVLPACALILFGDPPWVHSEPPWAWLLVTILPLAGLGFALAGSRFPIGAARISPDYGDSALNHQIRDFTLSSPRPLDR